MVGYISLEKVELIAKPTAKFCFLVYRLSLDTSHGSNIKISRLPTYVCRFNTANLPFVPYKRLQKMDFARYYPPRNKITRTLHFSFRYPFTVVANVVVIFVRKKLFRSDLKIFVSKSERNPFETDPV